MRTLQQDFLRQKMQALGLTREQFANQLGVKKRALDTWLLPVASKEARQMSESVWQLIEQRWPLALSQRPDCSLLDTLHCDGVPHLLSVGQFNRDSLEELFGIAALLEPVARRQKICPVLDGAVLGNLFFEPSTRTRLSFGAAFCRLGGSVCDTTGFTFSSMAKGESLADTARVVAGYFDILVLRHPETGSVAHFAEHIEVPVINGGDGSGEHPTQALVDIWTIAKEFRRLGKQIDGSCIALVGDLQHGRAVQSLFRLLQVFRSIHFKLVAPAGLEMPRELLEQAEAAGHRVTQHSVLETGLRDADVIYATRIQRERMTTEVMESYPARFRIDRNAIESFARKEAVILHPLPRDSTVEANDLATDLDGDPRLGIFRQTDNGIALRMAVFAVLLGVVPDLQGAMRDARWRRPARVGRQDATFHLL
ncbi:aspartate carbamoyltransferase [Uliginosibacterium sp. 31-16]|uniref:aspartate carbamoyltransferase n=1 Tax=Uliginosibacterium sp. 31-16 TaxID=3068315 RepID=UPI00273F0B98|nr:aspartate carbamoyltransferase [Uliginosibacterium sp. 31-16]MDP5239000.1 aspartate carbamoyltransferase [Uliginosibacterium sp. 31-16]